MLKFMANTPTLIAPTIEMRTGWPYELIINFINTYHTLADFGNFLNGFTKSPRLIVLNID